MKKGENYLAITYRDEQYISHKLLQFLNEYEDELGKYYRFINLSEKNSYVTINVNLFPIHEWKPEADQNVIWKTVVSKS